MSTEAWIRATVVVIVLSITAFVVAAYWGLIHPFVK